VFDSHKGYQVFNWVRSSTAERGILNPEVGGSNPLGLTKKRISDMGAGKVPTYNR
jgi:hypothetical protein